MTDCYYVLLASIQATDDFILKMFLYSLAAVSAYPVLGWTPAWMRRPAQTIYLAVGLIGFIAMLIAFGFLDIPNVALPACAF